MPAAVQSIVCDSTATDCPSPTLAPTDVVSNYVSDSSSRACAMSDHGATPTSRVQRADAVKIYVTLGLLLLFLSTYWLEPGGRRLSGEALESWARDEVALAWGGSACDSISVIMAECVNVTTPPARCDAALAAPTGLYANAAQFCAPLVSGHHMASCLLRPPASVECLVARGGVAWARTVWCHDDGGATARECWRADSLARITALLRSCRPTPCPLHLGDAGTTGVSGTI